MIPPMVAKLIPRLASNHDGEILATVAAIKRILSGSKLDLHDLAASLAKGGPSGFAHQARREAPPPRHKANAEFCLASGYAWREHEEKFLTDMKFRPNALTEKQQAWLDALVGKAKAHEELKDD